MKNVHWSLELEIEILKGDGTWQAMISSNKKAC